MTTTLLKNAALLDTERCTITPGQSLLITGDIIARIGADVADAGADQVIDCGGRTLMPGLIDCHVHVNTTEQNTIENTILPSSLVAARTVKTMNGMLMRGFTAVRDMGGADIGYIRAVEEGTIVGPDLMICGKMLCQTGGHQDVRFKWDWQDPAYLRGRLGAKARLCDGVPEVRHAAREELRAGAHFIKIIANGGMAAHGTPLSHLAFAEEEIAAIVEEARNADTYVAAHAYTDASVARCVRLGVTSIEHGFFVSPQTARMMADNGVTAVPTLAVFELGQSRKAAMELSPAARAENDRQVEAVYDCLRILEEAGVPMAYGTDLTHVTAHDRQLDEFRHRAKVLGSRAILQAATINGARLMRRDHEIGNIFQGARANLLVVDGDPLQDVTVLAEAANMHLIVKAGAVVKNTLPA